MEDIKIKGRIWIEIESGLKIGQGRARLLEKINELGSISEAAKSLKIPYRKAWQIVKNMNENSFYELVTKEVGGKLGGKSQLTEYGKKYMGKYKAIEEAFLNFTKQHK